MTKRFVEALEEVVMFSDAASLCGITRMTANNWLNWGEQEATNRELGLTHDDTKTVFLNFFYAVTRTRAENKNIFVKSVMGQSKNKNTLRDGELALKTLKALDPEGWGQRHQHVKQEVEFTGATGEIAVYAIPDNGRRKKKDNEGGEGEGDK